MRFNKTLRESSIRRRFLDARYDVLPSRFVAEPDKNRVMILNDGKDL